MAHMSQSFVSFISKTGVQDKPEIGIRIAVRDEIKEINKNSVAPRDRYQHLVGYGISFSRKKKTLGKSKLKALHFKKLLMSLGLKH